MRGRLALVGMLVLAGCGPVDDQPAVVATRAAAPRERLSVLVGRRGPIVFLVYPKAWGAGYEDAALAQRALELGVPGQRAIFDILAVHTGVGEHEATALDFDPRAAELLLTRREQVLCRGVSLAGVEPTPRRPAAALPLWLAWCGPEGALPPESLARWTFLLDVAEPPQDLEGAPVEGRLVLRPADASTTADADAGVVWLSTWRVEESAFLRHLRAPSADLLRVAEIKHAFRGDARTPRRG